MNLKTIGIIIRREYLNKVKKKSFLITTFIVPVLAGGGLIAMMAVMLNTKDKLKTIAVVDSSGIVMPELEDTESIDFKDYCDSNIDTVKNHLSDYTLDAVLAVSDIDTVSKTVTAEIFSVKPLGVEMVDVINSRVNSAVEDYRINSYGIDGLHQIMEDIKSNLKVKAYTIDEDGEEKVTDTDIYALFSMVIGIIIFLFVTLYGNMVMSAVIEEKSSRIVEVLVSSVKATELMFGKIIGIALVALTQFFLWIVLTGAIVSTAGSYLGNGISDVQNPAEMAQMMGVDPSQAEAVSVMTSQSGELSQVLTTVTNMPLGQIALAFIVFFIFGYMLYASMFAAVGSAVDNEGDTQQLTMPLTIPLMLAYIIALYAFKAPDSTIALWGSIIPFTSPIVMIARIPFGVPAWQLAVSISLLILTFVACAWVSAKIYKVGILMFGKKSTWKDLWKWLRQN